MISRRAFTDVAVSSLRMGESFQEPEVECYGLAWTSKYVSRILDSNLTRINFRTQVSSHSVLYAVHALSCARKMWVLPRSMLFVVQI